MTTLEDIIKKYILVNAVEHNGKALPKSVLGKFLGDQPKMRSRVLELKSRIEIECTKINKMNIKKQKELLEQMGYEKKSKKPEKKQMPELETGRKKFTVRFAPNPDGAIHLGNARPAILSYVYAKKYKGKFILRFDDTDPKIKTPEKKYYKWIEEDLKWLGIKWNRKIIASKRLSIYYKYAEKLIKDNKAYVCTCPQPKWKEIRDAGKVCPCRKKDSQIHLRRWKKMLKSNTNPKSGYHEGEAVVRIKTDPEAKNPAVRDWAAFRIIDNPKHPFSKKKLWPLYNFASAIDDHLTGTTHIFRAQEHATNETKQKYLYDYMKWKYPDVIILGRFSVADMVLSKSIIREGIKNRKYTGWDDQRLGTIRALRRRGFSPKAIKKIIIDIGPKPSDITISIENLAAYNRKIIDKVANRYFFIHKPKKITVEGLTKRKLKIPVHPERKNKKRSFSLGKTFYIDSTDFDKYRGLEVRLKDLCNIRLDKISKCEGYELKHIPKIHWLPSKHIPTRIIMPNGLIKGYGETNLRKAKPNDIVQFERFGFARIEKTGKSIVAVFAHK